MLSPAVSLYNNYNPYRLPYASNSATPAVDRLRIVYTNDWHENYPFASRVVSAFQRFGEEARQQGIDVLKLSAGDWNVSNESEQMDLDVGLNNMLGIHASTLGNHEFDPGSSALAKGLASAKFPSVATNVHVPPNSALYQRYLEQKLVTGPLVMTTPQGIRYGMVGLAVPEAWKFLNPDARMEGVASLSLQESIRRVQADVDQLRRTGVNRIILLSHCGYEADLEIARRTAGIDIIIGGHSHTKLPGVVPGRNLVSSAEGQPVMITQAGRGWMGTLDVLWDPWGSVHPLENTVYNPLSFPRSSQADGLINAYLGPEKPMGFMAEMMSTEQAGIEGENALANKVADTMREASGAEIAFFRGTELRSDVAQGVFTDRALKTLLPFNDRLVTFKMTGAQMMDVLNESARCLAKGDNHPGIMHASGLRYTVDKVSGKVVKAVIYDKDEHEWESVEPNRQYTVTTGEFLAKNKQEYVPFKQAPIIAKLPLTIRDSFGRYVLSQQGRPMCFRPDGRLQVINGRSSARFQAFA